MLFNRNEAELAIRDPVDFFEMFCNVKDGLRNSLFKSFGVGIVHTDSESRLKYSVTLRTVLEIAFLRVLA